MALTRYGQLHFVWPPAADNQNFAAYSLGTKVFKLFLNIKPNSAVFEGAPDVFFQTTRWDALPN